MNLERMGREGVVVDHGMSGAGWMWLMFGKTETDCCCWRMKTAYLLRSRKLLHTVYWRSVASGKQMSEMAWPQTD